MANADRPKSDGPDAPGIHNRGTIPPDPSGPRYADELDKYLDQLLDQALEETFPASDSLAVPMRRDIEKK
jgi:hypothetical protein